MPLRLSRAGWGEWGDDLYGTTENDTFLRGRGNEALELKLVRQVVEDSRKGYVVFDHQNDAPVAGQFLAVVFHVLRDWQRWS